MIIESEAIIPEGRVNGPVVPGGEEGCAHVVDQVNHFHLDKLGRSGEMKQGREDRRLVIINNQSS